MTSNAPLLRLFDPEDPLIDLGDNFAFGNVLVPLEPLTTPAASTDPDYPWAWLTSPYWPAGATRHDNDNGLTLPGLFPHLTVAAPVVSDELDFPFAWVLKKSNIPGNVFHDPGNGIFIRPLFPSVVVTTGGGATIQLFADTAGTSTVTGQLTVITELAGTIVGGASASAANIIGGVILVAYPIPYLLGRGGVRTQELRPTIYASSAVTAALEVVRPMASTMSGITTIQPKWISATEKAVISATASAGTSSIPNALDGVVDAFQFIHNNSQSPGDYIRFDFGEPVNLASLVMHCVVGSNFSTDYPRSWAIDVSNNDADWTQVATGSTGSAGVLTTNISVAGVYRYWRVRLTSSVTNHWRVNEFDFYGKEGATLKVFGGPSDLQVPEVAGTSSVTGTLQVGFLDGAGNFIVELAGTIAGTSSITGHLHLEVQQSRFLYLYVNVGVGFEPYDDPSGRADYVAFTGADGHNRDDFARYLYQFLNVGVGFTYDDPSARADFVAYTEPDGSNRDDFARYLYQYLRVIRGRKGYGRLAILPGYVDGNEFVPKPKPPSGVL